MSDTPALVVEDLHAWYGESHVLHGLSLTVGAGDCVIKLKAWPRIGVLVNHLRCVGTSACFFPIQMD